MRWLLIFLLFISLVMANNLTNDSNDNNLTLVGDLGAQVYKPENNCGDGKIQVGEGCSTCPQDVKCKSDEYCRNNKCVYEEKRNWSLIIGVVLGILIITGLVAFYFYWKEKKEIKEIGKTLEKPEEKKGVREFYQAAPKKEEPKKTIKDKLYEYIKRQQEKGIGREIVKKVLINKGWKKEKVEKKLKHIYDTKKRN